MELNKHQSEITDQLRKDLPREVYENLMEYTSQVKFIKNLIAPEHIRGFAKDRPKSLLYNDNRIDVDISNPHILENIDYFRQPAIFFDKNKKYTNIPPNSNPKSEYAEFWKQELYKWKYGMIRESDGEWIPGELYFYWNYSPIWLVKTIATSDGQRSQGERVRAFAKPWLGDYLYFHYTAKAKRLGKHGKILKCRGIGFSFKNASESPRNMYVFSGSGNPNFHLASEKTFLSGDKGIWGKIIDSLDWVAEHTPLPSMRTIDATKEMNIQLGYKDEYGSRKGLLSSVSAISLKDNPDKARGIRGPLIHYEEDGLFPNLEKAWNVNRKAVEDGGVSFGFMLAGGTGGVEGASFAGSEKLFYKPDAYNIMGLPNVYDKNSNGETECGFFWGAYLNRNECYDEVNGEPDVIKSLIEILLDRFKVKYNSSDANAITQKKAEEPITPQEAVMRTEGTVFPVADIKDYLESVSPKKESFLAEHYIGDLIYNNSGDVEWKPNSDKYPLRSYDSSDTNRTGCLEIFEMPRKNADGKIAQGRYIFGIDPIDADTGSSLFSIVGLDTFTDRIVCEYTGRPRLASDAYELSLKLIKFYNGVANYEKNLKGLFSYFDSKNCLFYLCDTPQILKDMEMVKSVNAYGNNAKGTHATLEINKWGRLLQAQWLLSNYNDTLNEEGVQDDKSLKLHHVRSLPYLEECIAWNSDGNFDRVSAMGMLFLLREDRVKRTQSIKANLGKQINTIANDKFFERNFNKNQQYKTIKY